MRKVLQVILILKFVFLNTALSYAGTWEIITHGGFDAAVSAWNKVALIFSDRSYTALFISVAILGAIILYLSVYTRLALGSKGNPLSGWGIPFMAGIVIYMAFIVPKDTIVIYDETLNRGPQAIDNIPRGVATIAGLLNKIEKGFTDIIWRASDPSTDYRIQAGGKGFTVIGNFIAGVDNLPNSFKATLYNYIHDCVLVEMQRPGTQLNVDAIQSGTQKANFIIQQSKNPAFYTVSYLSSSVGEAKTCSEVGDELLQWQNNPNNVLPIARYACLSSGYSFNDPNSFNACINSATAVLSRVTDNEITSLTGPNSLAIQSTIANITLQVVSKYNPEGAMKVLATSQSMSSFIGMGVHANSWIPVIKETLSALAVGLVPLFAIACVTPLAGKAFSIMAGMFVWLTVWGIVDSVIHSFALEFAYNNASMLKSIDGSAAGVASMLLFPSYSAKIGALFGAVRWFGLMLSSIITAMFLRFGGTAMAMLAGSLSGTVQASGAAYGEKILKNPAGVFSGEVMPQVSITNTAKALGGWGNYTSGMIQKQTGEMIAQAQIGNTFGSSTIAQAGFIREGSSIAKTSMVDNKIVQQLQALGFSQKEALAAGGSFGFNPQMVGGFMFLRNMGMVSGDTSDEILQALHYGTKTQTLYPGVYGTEVGGVSYITNFDESGTPIKTDLGQLNVKSEAFKQMELIKQAKEGKAIGHDYAKMVKFAIGNTAASGVDNRFEKSFIEEVSKEMLEKIRHSDSLKQFLRSQTDQEAFAEIRAGGSMLGGIVEAKAGFKMNVKTSSGEIKEFEVSRDFGEQLRAIQSNTVKDIIGRFSRNETDINKLKEWAKKANAQDFAEYIDVVKGVEVYKASDSITENVQFTAFTADRFSQVLDRPVSMPEAAAYIRKLSASSNSEDQKLLEELLGNYSFQRIYSPQIAGGQNTLVQKENAVTFQYQNIRNESEEMTNKKVPTVADPNKPLPQVNQEEFKKKAESVQTGLDNKTKEQAVLQLPIVGPMLAAPYNYGQYLTNAKLMPSIANDLGFTRWGDTPIFSTARDIYFKQQIPFRPTVTEAVMPVMFTSSQEAEKRSDSLRENIKNFVNRSGIK